MYEGWSRLADETFIYVTCGNSVTPPVCTLCIFNSAHSCVYPGKVNSGLENSLPGRTIVAFKAVRDVV